ncbi:hypothetical protein PVAP13_3NG216613 [Panicum virgatum]|uniref:Uncharacterized protein n=1 Tax=Panicum virgatum TaxID=38727 RepID=A0A8T0UF00_PANVG|nr:hypothetical protein PVAP13_3NG216613 [Panicum virgatum]
MRDQLLAALGGGDGTNAADSLHALTEKVARGGGGGKGCSEGGAASRGGRSPMPRPATRASTSSKSSPASAPIPPDPWRRRSRCSRTPPHLGGVHGPSHRGWCGGGGRRGRGTEERRVHRNDLRRSGEDAAAGGGGGPVRRRARQWGYHALQWAVLYNRVAAMQYILEVALCHRPPLRLPAPPPAPSSPPTD